jgi:tetratricopeptide (TPR) repeat protein
MQIRRNGIVAWKAFAEDHPDAALEAMRKAADQQDKLGQEEVDIPAREMLGDLLMLLHRPKEALVEYKVALKLSPNRLNGLLGAGAAAEALGNIPDASMYYAQASHNTDGGKDTSRVQHAKDYLAKYGTLGTH